MHHSLRTALVTLAAFASALVLSPAARAQGSLTPPAGTPAPAMKSLDQIEPRTDVLTLPGDAGHDHIISAPGSYFLSRDIASTSGRSAILIAADDVTLDLGGFAIRHVSGPASVNYRGINAATPHRNLVVRHGTVSGWARQGIALTAITGGLYEDIRVIDNAYGGMLVGARSILRRCVSHANGPSDADDRGISAGPGSLIEDCATHALRGVGAKGIVAGDGSTVVRCIVTGLTDGGAFGITLGTGSFARDCTVSNNTGTSFIAFLLGNHSRAEHCVATHNSGAESKGFAAWNGTVGAVISRSTASANAGSGIFLPSRCHVLDTTATANGVHGIHLAGTENVVERCFLSHNTGRGLYADGTGNLIIANRARGNTAGNYGWVGGNKNAVVLTVAPGFTNTDPTANLAY